MSRETDPRVLELRERFEQDPQFRALVKQILLTCVEHETEVDDVLDMARLLADAWKADGSMPKPKTWQEKVSEQVERLKTLSEWMPGGLKLKVDPNREFLNSGLEIEGTMKGYW